MPTPAGLIVAVSGGADSVALLHVLHRANQTNRIRLPLVVAHANHQLRGNESETDESFVAALADRLNLPFVAARLAVREAASKTTDSIEMAARRLRHNFLARIARDRGYSHVVLAHHSGDQAELVLIRLIRGGGSEGLGGMSTISPSPADSSVSLFRPFLDVDRIGLRDWLRKEGLDFREDSSNADGTILRNRIRAELLPLLEARYNPSIVRILTRTADILGTESDFVRSEAVRWLDSNQFDRFNEIHPALQRTVIREQLWRLGHIPDFELIERLRSSVGTRQSATGGELFVLSGQGKIARQPSALATVPNQMPVEVNLSGAKGVVRAFDRRFRWSLRSRPLPFGKTGIEQFDARAVGGSILIRHWRPGDRYRPLGFPSASKLQNIFTSRKIPVARRRQLLVFTSSADEIVWVEGLPPSHDFAIAKQTGPVLVIRCS